MPKIMTKIMTWTMTVTNTKTFTKIKARTIDQISAKFTPCLIELDGLHHRNGNKSQEKHETSLQSIVSVSFL